MRMFQFVALTPLGTADPSIAIAASRAGGLGVLDLAFVRDIHQARAAIATLVRYTDLPAGLRLADLPADLIDQLLENLPPTISTLIVSKIDAARLATYTQRLHQQQRQLWLEVTDVEQGQQAAQAGVDALIARGHESGGWVGEETSFILLQRLLAEVDLPVLALGGIGIHSAAACYAAGAAGVVLDSQLALTRESRLPAAVKTAIASMDGSETQCLGAELGKPFRIYARPGLPAVERLRASAINILLERDDQAPEQAALRWQEMVQAAVGWNTPQQHVWPLGQDAAFAAELARRYQTVGGVFAALRESIRAHIRSARAAHPFDIDSPLARSHATRYPIVQGPMTRVSDRAEFALSVAEGGGLPFLALALMPGAEVAKLLEETQRLLGNRPWGVGILGFVPLELRQQQMEVVQRFRPPFAIIAGGRPDQARELEKQGIPTYLHVPSPGLLKLFIEDGARRFIFEGRECGGHVGPRSSFVLWNTMIDVLLDKLPADASDCHVLFAGGIHDARSAAMVAAMAAPLVDRKVKIGALLGTAYLFTHEAVSSGAIQPGFQEEALRCERTALVETGPGHAIRCAPTPFVDLFEQEKQRLLRAGKSHDEIRLELEDLNMGRLRVASKGITRNPAHTQDRSAPRYLDVAKDHQHRDGMYMIGQVAALRDSTCSIEELHQQVAVEGTRLLDHVSTAPLASETAPAPQPAQIAIVGMASILPKATDLQAFWENVLEKVNAITEVPRERWNADLYFDPDPRAKDKIYSRWGGFLDDIEFDPLEFGMPPNSLPSIDSMQLLALKVARTALADAGYLDRPFDRSRASVILGASGGIGDLGGAYLLRASMPLIFGDQAPQVVDELGNLLPEWTEDSFAGLLPNVTAGRIANRLDFGGSNYIVDAACASSLTAVHLAVKELETRSTDMAIVGGVDATQNPFGFLCFSKTHALSPSGQVRTFDADGDGIAISEGVVMLVLKRLADAERDGDRVYAVIQSVAGSSDGRAKGLTAPRPEGQMLALQRAYEKAGIRPTTVGLFEAHGTGTAVGDRTEALSLSNFLEQSGAGQQTSAIGSVKSMIGHTKATAGVAGLAKVALALYHKVLPPTIGVTKPNTKARFGEGPLYINAETRPWVHSAEDHPRRAGVSAFGFGGTNFHAVVEEYTGSLVPQPQIIQRWPNELLLWSANDRAQLAAALASLEQSLAQGAQPTLADLAYSLYEKYSTQAGSTHARLAIVSASLEQLREQLAATRKALETQAAVQGIKGVAFAEGAPEGKVAFLFPGQGSQYTNMLRDLAIMFPEARETFEHADRVLADSFPKRLSGYIFPPPAFTKEEEQVQQQALTQTNVAQPALGAADTALLHVLRELGVAPEMVAGHSYGEYVALYAAGVIDEPTLAILSEARGRSIIEAAESDLGTMAAVQAPAEKVTAALSPIADVWVANLNAPQQTIISGTRAGVAHAMEHLQAQGLSVRAIPVSCAFHSPLVAPAQERLASALKTATFSAAQIPVFSNTTAAAHSDQPAEIAQLLAEHLVKPVRFVEEIEAMYAAGARVFVEVGPRHVLTGLTQQILGERPHIAVAMDMAARNGLTQLLLGLGQLAAHGVPVQLDRLFQGRTLRRLNLNALVADTIPKPASPTTWIVNGGGAKPINKPVPVSRYLAAPSEPLRLLSGNDTPSEPAKAIQNVIEHHGAPHNNGATHTFVPTTPAPVAFAPPPGTQAPVVAPPVTPSAPATPPPTGDSRAQVMLQFQHVMGRFLETQQHVMLGYLHGAAAPLPAGPTPGSATPPPAQVMPPIVPASAVPSVVVPPGAAVEAQPEPEANTPMPVAPIRKLPSLAQLTEQLLQIVSERTGYPAEMLDLDVDMEADLGIDSIKRVEILGALQRTVIPPERQAGQEAMEHLTSIKTLRGIVQWLEQAMQSGAPVHQNGTSAPLPAPAAPVSARLSMAQLTEQLLQIVSERTGYPAEMLDLDVDMEADLGIDSIKRVEILGALQRAVIPPERQGGQEAMEHLTSIKTLRGIVEWLDQALQGELHAPQNKAANAENAAPPAPVVDRPAPGGAARSIVTVTDAPGIPPGLPHFAANQTFLITDDQHGVASALAEQIRRHGGNAALVRLGTSVAALGPQLYQADLSDPATTAELVALVAREQGPLCGIIHLLPLAKRANSNPIDLHSWREQVRREVKSLFYLVSVAASDMKRAGETIPTMVLAASALGGTWGLNGASADAFPAQGGLAGMIKTLAIEWPSVRCKAVDLDPANPPMTLAEQLLGELVANDELVEVGYPGKRRITLTPVLAPLDGTAPKTLEIESDWVLLITGGARGITAEVAYDLARRYRPTLVLVGSSPMPAPETPETAGLTTQQELKTALMSQIKQAGMPLSLPQIEAAYNRLLKDREIQANLERIAATGATIRYEQVDVRDEQDLTALVERVYREHGRLDGVIHGAGIIEDKLIGDKTPESFDRVFDTKVDSAFTLSRVLQPESLRFFVLFASAAGVYGNRGQGDYAAANEALNKLAILLDAHWPARVVAMNWGPWAKTGMVSAEVQRQFAERGVELISLADGCRALDQEIRNGQRGEAEIVIGSGAWGSKPIKQPQTSKIHTSQPNGTLNHNRANHTSVATVLPLLQRAQPATSIGGSVEVLRTLDPAYDIFLNDHQLDGKPVMPMAGAMELMAEIVQQGWSDMQVIGVRDLQVLKGIVVEQPRTIKVVARAQTDPSYERLGVDVKVEIIDPERPGQPFYRAVVELADRLPEAPTYTPPATRLQPFPIDVDTSYEQWLFHGPLFAGIRSINGMSNEGMLAQLIPSQPAQCLVDKPSGEWLIDPVVLDSGLQLIILWSRAQNDMTPLPSRFQRYRRYGSLRSAHISCWLQASASPDGHAVLASLFFMDADNRLLGVLEDLECTASKALNRLSGTISGD